MVKILTICMGSSCFCRGNEENLKIIEEYIKERELSHKVELAGTRCEQMCDRGPVIHIDDKVYEKVDSVVLLDILNKEL